MKRLFNIIAVLLLIPALAVANHGKFKGKYTKEKKINKEYTVNPGAGLQIDNSYGNLDIVTWNENRTVIEVTIKTNGNDEAKVQAKLDKISVDFTANATLVTAKTLFGESKKGGNSWSSWWSGNSKNSNVSIEVNYKIKMPITNTVNLDNDYGTISLNKLEGNARINCDYGQLIIGELLADNNYLNFDYTDKSTIRYMKSGKIDADYSGFTLDKVEALELNADYTRSEIGQVGACNYNCDYGKVVIDQVTDIIGRGDYLNTSLGTVNGNVNLNTDYGSIKISRMSNKAKNVTIKADYTGVKMGFESGYNFNFDVDLSYSSLKGTEYVTVTKSDKDYTSKMYEGYHGNQNSGNIVDINSDYGGVTFIKM